METLFDDPKKIQILAVVGTGLFSLVLKAVFDPRRVLKASDLPEATRFRCSGGTFCERIPAANRKYNWCTYAEGAYLQCSLLFLLTLVNRFIKEMDIPFHVPNLTASSGSYGWVNTLPMFLACFVMTAFFPGVQYFGKDLEKVMLKYKKHSADKNKAAMQCSALVAVYGVALIAGPWTLVLWLTWPRA